MISVVICSFNPRPEALRRTLESIGRQSLDASEYELVVVDNGSEPAVASLKCVQDAGARVVVESQRGLTAARGRAAGEARGEVLVFVDDDNVLQSDYLTHAREIMEDPQIGVVSGEIVPEYSVPPPSWLPDFETWLAVRRYPDDRLYLTSVPEVSHFYPIGAGCCIRRALLREYFEATAEPDRIQGRSGTALQSGEDIDIDLFAVRRGFLVGVTGQLRLTHLIPPERTRPRYIARLIAGSLESLYRVNAKWRRNLGTDPMPYFKGSRLSAAVSMAALVPFIWSTKRRLLLRQQAKLFALTLRRRAEG